MFHRGEKRWAKLWGVLLALALLAVACGGSDDTTEASTSAEASSETESETSAETESETSAETESETSAETESEDTSEPVNTDPVVVCELAYYTGDFGDLGETLTMTFGSRSKR